MALVKKRVWLLSIFGTIILLGVGHEIYLKSSAKTEYSKLYNARIDGIVANVKSGNGIEYLTINDSRTFELVPIRDSTNNYKSFLDIAKVGDRIYKTKGSDTIKMFHDGRFLIFRFRKF